MKFPALVVVAVLSLALPLGAFAAGTRHASSRLVLTKSKKGKKKRGKSSKSPKRRAAKKGRKTRRPTSLSGAPASASPPVRAASATAPGALRPAVAGSMRTLERPGVDANVNSDIVPLPMAPVEPRPPRSLTNPEPGPAAIAVSPEKADEGL